MLLCAAQVALNCGAHDSGRLPCRVSDTTHQVLSLRRRCKLEIKQCEGLTHSLNIGLPITYLHAFQLKSLLWQSISSLTLKYLRSSTHSACGVTPEVLILLYFGISMCSEILTLDFTCLGQSASKKRSSDINDAQCN